MRKFKLQLFLFLLTYKFLLFLFINEKKQELTNDIFVNTRSFAELTAESIVNDYNLYLAQKGFIYFNRNIQNLFQKLRNDGFHLGIVGGGTYSKIIYQLCDTGNLFEHIFSECGCIYHRNGYIAYKKNIRDHKYYPEINEIIYKRIVELAQVNFDKKIYLYLIEGKGSVERAEKENINLKDDNELIYISINDFINAKEITIGKDLYNTETERLLKK